VTDGIARDVAITWTGAVGCWLYLWLLYRHGRQGTGPQRFLLIILGALLFVRGFDWLSGEVAIGRITFAIAVWLPLAITLFVERVLRRHSPLWVKLVSLATPIVFFPVSLIAGPSRYPAWSLGFAICFVAVMLINGILLLMRRRSTLSVGENRVAVTLVLLAFISAPLVASDFRTGIGFPSVRLGAIAALLFTYSMVAVATRRSSVLTSVSRYLLLLASALLLSGLLALAKSGGSPGDWWAATLSALPLAFAWVILTAIAVNVRTLSLESGSQEFLDWLSQVQFASPDAYLRALGRAPDAQTHVLLGPPELQEYDLTVLTDGCVGPDTTVSLDRVRKLAVENGNTRADWAEQWVDLLERTGMTHGFMVRSAPPSVFLLRLPATTSSVAAQIRLAVMKHLGEEASTHWRKTEVAPATK
jgi:hypothetical protein